MKSRADKKELPKLNSILLTFFGFSLILVAVFFSFGSVALFSLPVIIAVSFLILFLSAVLNLFVFEHIKNKAVDKKATQIQKKPKNKFDEFIYRIGFFSSVFNYGVFFLGILIRDHINNESVRNMIFPITITLLVLQTAFLIFRFIWLCKINYYN
jgi:protein-S-isoprenylcysteine O-methyltransferase Ste14